MLSRVNRINRNFVCSRVSRKFNSTETHRVRLQSDDFLPDTTESVVKHLNKRGLIASITHDTLEELTEKKRFGLYCGADPTAKSLHLGNLLPLMILLHFNLRGHNVVGIVGGATGTVGDPSGRTTERTQMEQKEREENVQKIQNQLSQFLENGVEYAKSRGYPYNDSGSIKTRNNFEWWKDISMLGFLAEYGRFIRVGSMLARDSIKSRLESPNGIGFNEFTYQILQAFDFWWLFKNEKVQIQVGGNDQWGNITAGVDLISKLKTHVNSTLPKKERLNDNAYGITVPLLTTSSGEKFGKSAGNAVFIDKNITPPYQLYQFFIKSTDQDVEKLLKIFSLIPLEKIDQIMAKHNEDPTLRYAQRILSIEATDLLHGEGSGEKAALVSSILFPLPEQPYPDIDTEIIIESFRDSGIIQTIPKDQLLGKKLSEVVAKILGSSNNAGRKHVSNGSVYIGFSREKVDQNDIMTLDEDNLIDNQLLLLRIGKNNYHLVQLV